MAFRFSVCFALLIAGIAVSAPRTPAMAQDGGVDRHIGYYYPAHPEPEVYVARAGVMPEATRALRIGFITGLTKSQLEKESHPNVVIFAKGSEGEKMIVVSLEEGYIDTLFRARAFFALLTGSARTLPIFRELGVEDSFTFFDLARLLGFKQITWSNGVDESYQWQLRSPE